MPSVLRAVRPRQTIAAVVLGVALSIRSAAAQEPLIVPVDGADEIQRSVSTGRFFPSGTTLTPCEPDKPVAYAGIRGVFRLWAGQFRVEQTAPGAWTLTVRSDDGTDPQEISLGGDAPGSATVWTTGLLSGSRATITLTGPAGADRCPIIRLEQELRQVEPGQLRGIVDKDERWADPSPFLDAAADASNLKKWGAGIVHLDVLTETNVSVPCTGFFIAPHVMMTAAHCIGSRASARRAQLRIGTRIISGSRLRLLMARRLDFSLVFVTGEPQTNVLTLSEDTDVELVTWQWPTSDERKISAVGCVPVLPERFDGIHLKHKCDTQPGSSGSPVQARSGGSVIGIHVQGCFENGTPRCVNRALRSSEIRRSILELEQELRAADPEGAAEVFSVIGRLPDR